MNFKRMISLFLASSTLTSMCGCAAINSGKDDINKSFISITSDGTPSIACNNYRIDFSANGGIILVNLSLLESPTSIPTEDSIMFTCSEPANVNIRGNDVPNRKYTVTEYSAPYTDFSTNENGYTCYAEVVTESGSRIGFEDTYFITETSEFAVSRKVTVKEAAENDYGFQSVYRFEDKNTSKNSREFDFFIPAILFKDSTHIGNRIGSNLNVDRMYVKETRTGLPLAMLRRKSDNYSVAITHLEPEITVNGVVGGGKDGEVNGKLQYGSVGYSIMEGVSVDFCYPSYEGPVVYPYQVTGKNIFHPITADFSHSYKLSIIPATEDTYAKSMQVSYKKAFAAESPSVTDKIDINQIYTDAIDIYADTYREFGKGDVIAAGVPWSFNLHTNRVAEYTFQMGFVGQQTSVGYNMMKFGYETDDMELVEKGKAIIDFWSSDTIMGNALPYVWWDPVHSVEGGRPRDYPSYLRSFCDGMEGILDAYKLSVSKGQENENWLKAICKVADFLVNNQNPDGSYYRCYNVDGSVYTDTSDLIYQGTSKLNTHTALRFLARMYELTNDESYKETLIKAAEYCYNEFYLGIEKYVGATPDQHNLVDKEAAIYAMYGFNAVYAITNDAKYLEASQHAAVMAMSFVYCYDFCCPSEEENDRINSFKNGNVIGFSLIATGHSGADNYAASMYFELFKLYVYTGDQFFYDAALFIQQNTKLSCDYDGAMGYKYRAIGPEASNVAEFNFSSIGYWLTWSSIVNIKPIGYMYDAFGASDVRALPKDRNLLLEQLNVYGAGGKLNY